MQRAQDGLKIINTAPRACRLMASHVFSSLLVQLRVVCLCSCLALELDFCIWSFQAVMSCCACWGFRR